MWASAVSSKKGTASESGAMPRPGGIAAAPASRPNAEASAPQPTTNRTAKRFRDRMGKGRPLKDAWVAHGRKAGFRLLTRFLGGAAHLDQPASCFPRSLGLPAGH